MPIPAAMSKRVSLPDDERKLAALRRTRAVATGALALCFMLFLVAKWLESRHPLFGALAAFAEAA
ncbi:MAG: DUF445 domain-containing protein, partial [Rhizobiaceae bacterium]